ncbi:MAG TPA: rhomboid family intramembrane serine protease [Vicinamibacterales bacterium]|nr:rhomboid family intramembrane serine protease [Vicinamibacterales bacterium]
MFKRQTTGAVVCASCGQLVGVNDDTCYNCGRRNPSLWGYGPALRSLGRDLGFVTFVTGACIVVFGLTLVASGGDIGFGGLFSLLSPSGQALGMFGASGAIPVFVLDRWWTVLSAAWLHGGLLHIFFNMYWIRQLAPSVADLYGPGRMVIVYTVAAIVGFSASSLAGAWLGAVPLIGGAEFTVGASAPIFGLLGALVYYGRRGGSSQIHSQAMMLATVMFVFGLVMPHVDNWAHAGGFGGGYLASRFLDPLKPERVDHLLAAVICLALSVLSIVASVLHWFWLLSLETR